jgi:hypothetical protein
MLGLVKFINSPVSQVTARAQHDSRRNTRCSKSNRRDKSSRLWVSNRLSLHSYKPGDASKKRRKKAWRNTSHLGTFRHMTSLKMSALCQHLRFEITELQLHMIPLKHPFAYLVPIRTSTAAMSMRLLVSDTSHWSQHCVVALSSKNKAHPELFPITSSITCPWKKP